MELDFSFLEQMQKRSKYNIVLREKYLRLQEEEKKLSGGAGRRITQKRIAGRVGVSDSYISLWISNQREFDFPILEKMAMVLLEEQILLEGRKNEKKQ